LPVIYARFFSTTNPIGETIVFTVRGMAVVVCVLYTAACPVAPVGPVYPVGPVGPVVPVVPV
jgi:hypothetical protein